jgi:hypothetical protein
MFADVMETTVLSDHHQAVPEPLSNYHKPHGKERTQDCTNPN